MMRYKIKKSYKAYPLFVLRFLEVVGNASFASSLQSSLLMLHILSFFVH